jgi:hypothetical protein
MKGRQTEEADIGVVIRDERVTTLGDRVGEILRFCRSAARHIVRPAGRFPLAGRGGANA